MVRKIRSLIPVLLIFILTIEILSIVIFPLMTNSLEGPLDNQGLIYNTQYNLLSLGYDPGPIDGFWGKKTEAAVKNFQQQNGLIATGILDETTKKYYSQ